MEAQTRRRPQEQPLPPCRIPTSTSGAALDCRFARKVARRGFAKAAFANGGLFGHDSRRSGQNRRHSQFWHVPMRTPPSRGSLSSPLFLSRRCSPGVLRDRAIPGRASRGFAGMRFANGALFDHLDAGCGQNRRHSQSRARAHACQAKNAHSSRRILHLCALALEKLAPSRQQAARLHTCQWRRSRLWPSSYPTARVFRRIRSNIYFVRTPKCSRQIQANEKGQSTGVNVSE
mgnify:CR=1 FL=1